jgi:hypothetical protein
LTSPFPFLLNDYAASFERYRFLVEAINKLKGLIRARMR